MSARSLAAAFSMALISACSVSVDYGDGAFLCEQTTDCQPGFVCEQNHCARPRDVVTNEAGFRRRLLVSGMTNSVANFPILVRLDASRIRYTEAGDGGSDLTFVGADGARLKHEVESWDPSGESLVWVKLPMLDNETWFDMLVGTGAIPVAADDEAVWADYDLVYHFGQAPLDSSPQRLPGTAEGGADITVGRIGNGWRFDGVDDSIRVASEARLLANREGVTLSSWAKTSTGGSLIEISVMGLVVSRAFLAFDSTDGVEFGLRNLDAAMPVFNVSSATPHEADAWHWLVATADLPAGRICLYVDGVLVSETSGLAIDPPRTPDSGNDVAYIGRNEGALNGFFAGAVDEIRVSGTAVDAARVTTEYQSMTDSLLTFGAEEVIE